MWPRTRLHLGAVVRWRSGQGQLIARARTDELPLTSILPARDGRDARQRPGEQLWGASQRKLGGGSVFTTNERPGRQHVAFAASAGSVVAVDLKGR